MGGQSTVGEFEQLVLLAILRLEDDAYAVTIRREIEERTGRAASRGAVYTTLDRLEQKQLIRSWMGESRSEPGGKARRYFGLEEAGIEALRTSREALMNMWAGLEPRLGETA